MDPTSQELLDFVCVRMREHRQLVQSWEHRHRTAVVQLVCNMVHLLVLRQFCMQIRDMPSANDMIGRSDFRRQVMSHLMDNERICQDVLQMNPIDFETLCNKLHNTGLLKDYSRSTIEEQVAKFLHVLEQNWKYCVIGCYFRRSKETISHHFHNVLRAIISLKNQFLKQSDGVDVAPQIQQSSRFHPYFKGSMSRTNRKDNGKNFTWTGEFDDLLVDALLNEKTKGNRHDGTFTTQAYTNIMLALTPLLGPRLEKSHIKNRVKTLKKKCAECKDLFHGLSGFAWNPETSMFEATNEVWMDLIQAKPSASKWMTKPMRNYGKLYAIYGEDQVTGEGAESAREKVMRWQSEGTLNLNDDSFALDNDSSWANTANTDTNHMSPSSAQYSPTPMSEGGASSKGKKRKASMIEAMEKQFEYVTESMNKVANVLQEGNEILKTSNLIAERAVDVVEKGRPRFYSEGEIYSAVEQLGFQRSMQLDAYLFLINSNTSARSFFGTPSPMRAEVLMKMMNLP